MAETTGIEWTDSTMNFWEGCTKVGPGCDHCYAAERDIRWHAGSHWGPGAPRRQMIASTRKRPLIWQKNAEVFKAMHGHPQRVFCSSLADIFDNEVSPEWRAEAFATMEATPDLRWQLCTKRVSNIEKMVPAPWSTNDRWPRNVGVLITTVTPEEVRRDVPRLLDLKHRFDIPWVGLSIEPMIADVGDALYDVIGHPAIDVDWLILGGESGPQARPCDLAWIRSVMRFTNHPRPERNTAIFVKQMGDKPTFGSTLLSFTGKGGDMSEWPADLQLQQFPPALC